jgi:hypothetical protein
MNKKVNIFARNITDRSLSRKFLLKAIALLPLLGLTLTGCSSDGSYNFKTSSDAVETYHQYLTSVQNIKKSNTEDFSKEISHWKEVNDTVIHFLMKDSTLLKDHNVAAQLSIIHDSVRNEMLRLSETWRYSYDDVLKIKEITSQFQNDKDLQEAVTSAEPFFIELNDIPVIEGNKTAILSMYRGFLSISKANGIKNKKEMLAFIKQEDHYFRSFLAHLYEMDNEPISDITRDTEIICRSIFLSAREGKISARDAMVYMSMRTVRRLLQNSVVCVTSINNQQIKNKAQGNAYVWMIIQPFISIDQFSIATLTPAEKSNFNYIVNQLPKSVKFAKTFDIDQRSLNYLLPQQLLKFYILSL